MEIDRLIMKYTQHLNMSNIDGVLIDEDEANIEMGILSDNKSITLKS